MYIRSVPYWCCWWWKRNIMINFPHVWVSFHLSPSLYFIPFKKVGCYKKKKKKTFCLLLLFLVRPHFLYSVSFAPLYLSLSLPSASSLLSVFQIALRCFAYRACAARTTSNTMCNGKQQQRSSQTHTLSTQCNHFRQLGAQL